MVKHVSFRLGKHGGREQLAELVHLLGSNHGVVGIGEREAKITIIFGCSRNEAKSLKLDHTVIAVVNLEGLEDSAINRAVIGLRITGAYVVKFDKRSPEEAAQKIADLLRTL